MGRLWNNKEEIDLVAFDDEKIAYIECKWQNSVNEEKVRNQLIKKSGLIKTDKKESFLVFTKEKFLED